jgi:hypothetical protein
MEKINIILKKEKRSAYNSIKLMGININGIIFGGMVRDEIIATHYKLLFDEHCGEANKKNYKKFWNMNYHVETIKRTLIPNDMDIYFQNNESAETFLTSLGTYATSFNGNVIIRDSILYELEENMIHKKVAVNLFIGRTISYAGIHLRLKIDVVINNSANNIIEPPFNNGDFTCNLFIMRKSIYNNYEIRLSNNTGTILDSVSFIKKSNIQTKIMNDLIENKTEFIRTSFRDDAEYINGMRILKMLDKNMKITNLLFREIEETSSIENCDICQMSLQTEETSRESYIELLTNKHAINVMHKPCFIRYLTNEVYKKNINEGTNEIECRCTRRNLFNFKNSYKYSCVF